jgi:hypothetical protein
VRGARPLPVSPRLPVPARVGPRRRMRSFSAAPPGPQEIKYWMGLRFTEAKAVTGKSAVSFIRAGSRESQLGVKRLNGRDIFRERSGGDCAFRFNRTENSDLMPVLIPRVMGCDRCAPTFACQLT